MKMIVVRVSEQDQIDRGQVRESQARALDAFEEEEPVGEIRIDEHVQVVELHEERGVPDPGDRDVAAGQFGKIRSSMLPDARREQGLPNHLIKKSARIEMV